MSNNSYLLTNHSHLDCPVFTEPEKYLINQFNVWIEGVTQTCVAIPGFLGEYQKTNNSSFKALIYSVFCLLRALKPFCFSATIDFIPLMCKLDRREFNICKHCQRLYLLQIWHALLFYYQLSHNTNIT